MQRHNEESLYLDMSMASTPLDYYRDRLIGPGELIEKLYKFDPIYLPGTSTHELNPFLVSSLKEGYLWHADPDTLNDPFDCYKSLVRYSDPSIEVIRWIAQHRGYGSYSQIEDEIYRLWNNKDEVINAYRATTPTWYISSLTANQVTNTMWSHYAASHTGLSLTFDNHRLAEGGLIFVKVQYEEEFKPVNFFDTPEESLLNMITTKLRAWQYEQEHRSFEERVGKHFFDKSCLVGITFGCKSSPEAINKIMSLVNGAGYTNISWSQAELLPDSFEIAINPIKRK